MSAITFDYAAWIARYPEFSSVSQPTAQEYFNEATLYCSNSDNSPVSNLSVRAQFLNMITAHIAQISRLDASGQLQSTLVGRISNATQGSVSVGTEMPNQSAMAAWFNQTPYGAAYWRASARFRTFRYRPGCVPLFQFAGAFGYRRF